MKNKSVQMAKEALAEKELALTKALEAVELAKQEKGEAYTALCKAQMDADSGLPSCDCVSIREYGRGDPVLVARMAILRKTPSGLLVVRRLGEPDGQLYHFKWSPYSSTYHEKKKRERFYSGSRTELRNVPAEFIPKSEAA